MQHRPTIVLALLASFLLLAPGHPRTHAQTRLVSLVSQDQGHVALGLALRRLNVSGTFLQAIAHPDDEHNQLYALLTHGQGLRSVDVHTTRGEGGQNEIGPELFRDLGVLRTSELLSAHRLDGAEQWFTRTIDYGYSFSPPEIYEKWGRRDAVGDLVRFIRTFRPDVVLTMNVQGRGGDRAHEATAVVTREAFRAAADPSQYPEQIRQGLRPWQARKLYFAGGFGGFGGPPPGAGAPPGAAVTPPPAGAGRPAAPPPTAGAPPPAAPAGRLATIDTLTFDPLLGRTYSEVGADARTNHKCQGMGQLPPLPGGIGGGRGFGGPARYQLADTTMAGQKDKDETSLFDGIDTSLAALARYAGPKPPEALTSGLAAVSRAAVRAQTAFAAGDDAGTTAPIVSGLGAVRALRASLGSMGLSDEARFEIDFRLANEAEDFERAALAAHGLVFEAIADDGLVIGGQPLRLSILVANRGPIDINVTGITSAGFAAPAPCKAGTVTRGGFLTCVADATVPASARLTEPYWTDEYWNTPTPKAAINIYPDDVPFGAPFRPSPFRVRFTLSVSGVTVSKDVVVQFRYPKDLFIGEKRMELNVVPAFSVMTSPAAAVVPAASRGTRGPAKPVEREIHVSVTNGTRGAAEAAVALDVPAGWTATPASAPLSFANEDESLTTRFTVRVPAAVEPGNYKVRAVVSSTATGANRFSAGYQEIDYPHIERRQVIKPAETDIKVIDVRTAPNVKVGYIVGAGDQVPSAIEQLGAKVSFIESDELAWGNLSAYDVIVTGVRAYAKRTDLRAYNRRLIEYAERGGTVIVQYNKMEFNQAQFGPYPAKVGNGRVTDENAPVTVLVPGHPVFGIPNTITEATWKGWVQERGLYYLGEKDPRYVDLVSMEDPFPDNPGVKLGSLVEAPVGKGRWLYLGIGLWRQLPAQTEGAYQLLANLIALGKNPPAVVKPAGKGAAPVK